MSGGLFGVSPWWAGCPPVGHLVARHEVELDRHAGVAQAAHRVEEHEPALAFEVAADEQHAERAGAVTIAPLVGRYADQRA